MTIGMEPTSTTSDFSTSESKSPDAFRTISEVADNLRLPQHVLRFWESKFPQIKPLKRGGGRRYYRPDDIRVIHDIKDLLYNKGYTIRGVQQLLSKGNGVSIARSMVAEPQIPHTLSTQTTTSTQQRLPLATQPAQSLSPDKRHEIEGVLGELRAIRKMLAQSGI